MPWPRRTYAVLPPNKTIPRRFLRPLVKLMEAGDSAFFKPDAEPVAGGLGYEAVAEIVARGEEAIALAPTAAEFLAHLGNLPPGRIVPKPRPMNVEGEPRIAVEVFAE